MGLGKALEKIWKRQAVLQNPKEPTLGQSKNTNRAYGRQWQRFVSWCARENLEALPAQGGTVARYLYHLGSAGLSMATQEQALAAIKKMHREAGLPLPTGRELESTWAEIRRSSRAAPKRRARPIEASDLTKMVAALESDKLIDIRDRAILLLGFAGAFRRAELAQLRCEDLEFQDDGVVVLLRSSGAAGEERRRVVIPETINSGLRPVEALVWWRLSSGVEDGPLFRAIDRHGNMSWRPISDRSIARIVKKAAERAGLDSVGISIQSLRG